MFEYLCPPVYYYNNQVAVGSSNFRKNCSVLDESEITEHGLFSGAMHIHSAFGIVLNLRKARVRESLNIEI